VPDVELPEEVPVLEPEVEDVEPAPEGEPVLEPGVVAAPPELEGPLVGPEEELEPVVLAPVPGVGAEAPDAPVPPVGAGGWLIFKGL
jgi:hypothetical protein